MKAAEVSKASAALVKSQFVAWLGTLAAREREQGIPAGNVLPDLKDPSKRGAAALRGLRYRDGLGQVELAKKIGARQQDISGMEKGKRPIGKDMAKRLALVFKVDYRVFL